MPDGYPFSLQSSAEGLRSRSFGYPSGITHNADPTVPSAEYDAFAPTFARSRDAMRWEEAEKLVRIFADLVPSERVPKILDVGCGSGRLIPVLEDVFGKGGFVYLGTDLSSGMLSEARKRYTGFRFEHCDMREISDFSPVTETFGQAGPDAIFAIASFHHLLTRSDRLKALAGFRHVLAPGGFLAMTCWNLLSVSNVSKYEKFRNPEGIFEIPIGVSVRRYVGLEKSALSEELRSEGFELRSFESNERNLWVAATSKSRD